MIYRTPREKIDEYFASGKLSQSRLKLLIQGVDVFNDIKDEQEASLYFEEKGFFVIGSAVDCILTEGQQAFQEKYFMADCPKPSDTIMSIVQQVFDRECRLTEGFPPADLEMFLQNDPNNTLEECITFHNYQPNWKMPTKRAKVIEQGQLYYAELVKSIGKVILSLEQAHIILSIVNSIMENPMTAQPFKGDLHPEGVDYHHQVIIEFTYRGVELQCLLDILRVNHVEKSLKVIDFKTLSSPTIKFIDSLRTRRYDFQVVLYSLALTEWRRQNPKFLDYKILNPGFICETTALDKQGNPLCYTLSDDLVNIAMYGAEFSQAVTSKDDLGPRGLSLVTRRIMGINEVIDLYEWHVDNGFERDKVVVENGGHLILGWEGIRDGNSTK